MLTFSRLLLTFTLLLSAGAIASAAGQPIRVALYADEGAGSGGINTVEGQLRDEGMTVVRVTGEEIAGGILSGDFDAVVFTGGSGSRQGNTLGEEGRAKVRQFVSDGGGYVGICAGAYLACTNFSWGVGVLNARTVSPQWRRGRGNVEVEITEAGQEVSGIPTGIHEIRYANGPILMPHDREDLPPYETVAYFRTELAENNTPEGIMVDSPAIARAFFGKGRVVVSSPHPESTAGMDGTFAPAAVRWAAGGRDSRSVRHLVAVGGGPIGDDIRRHLLSLSPVEDPSVLVIPHAAREGNLESSGERHAEHFQRLGLSKVEILDLTNPETARQAIETCDVIWMPGGLQRRLMAALDEAGLADAVRARFAAGIPVGGTSAGAAIMSETMLAGSRLDETTGAPDPIITHGLGFLPEIIVDQHFTERNRLPRLREAVRRHPSLTGVGIDEETALLFDGEKFRVMGPGTVTVVRLLETDGDEPAFAEAVLRAGESFELDTFLNLVATQ